MSNSPLFCAFCAKSQYEVKHLIGSYHVYICENCVQQCVEIITTLSGGEVEYASWFVPQDSKVRSDNAPVEAT